MSSAQKSYILRSSFTSANNHPISSLLGHNRLFGGVVEGVTSMIIFEVVVESPADFLLFCGDFAAEGADVFGEMDVAAFEEFEAAHFGCAVGI